MAVIQYDVVLYGATGFTGSLAAQYLATHPQAPKVAFAGRSPTKLRAVRDKLVDVPKERIESIGLMEASADDKESLVRLARSAKVVINAVGPYGLYGGYDVAQAVAQAGTGYVDLTGETNVYAHVVHDLHNVAKQTGAVIVPSSGFDSLPFDLSAYFAAQEVKKVDGPSADIGQVLLGYQVQAGLSGGTLHSAVTISRDPEALRYGRPYWLSPTEGTQRTRALQPRYLPQFGKYGTVSLITPHNTRVVNRSWGLFEEARVPVRYGAAFAYLEGSVASSYIRACAALAFFHIFTWVLITFHFVGELLTKMLPAGNGPSLEEQLKGYADVRAVAYGQNTETKGVSTFRVKGDPGYLKTAAFLAETALAIALDRDLLTPLAQQGGVLTPATIGAEVLRERLTKFAGVTIQTSDVTRVRDLALLLTRAQ